MLVVTVSLCEQTDSVPEEATITASSVCKAPEVPYTVCDGGRDGGTIVCVVCWDCRLGDCESENG